MITPERIQMHTARRADYTDGRGRWYTSFPSRVWERSDNGKWYSREATAYDRARRTMTANAMFPVS